MPRLPSCRLPPLTVEALLDAPLALPALRALEALLCAVKAEADAAEAADAASSNSPEVTCHERLGVAGVHPEAGRDEEGVAPLRIW